MKKRLEVRTTFKVLTFAAWLHVRLFHFMLIHQKTVSRKGWELAEQVQNVWSKRTQFGMHFAIRISHSGGKRRDGSKLCFRIKLIHRPVANIPVYYFRGARGWLGAQEEKYFVWGAYSAGRPRNFAMFPVRPVIYCWFYGRTSSDLIAVWLYLHERTAHARSRPVQSWRAFTCCSKWFGKSGARATGQNQYVS